MSHPSPCLAAHVKETNQFLQNTPQELQVCKHMTTVNNESHEYTSQVSWANKECTAHEICN